MTDDVVSTLSPELRNALLQKLTAALEAGSNNPLLDRADCLASEDSSVNIVECLNSILSEAKDQFIKTFGFNEELTQKYEFVAERSLVCSEGDVNNPFLQSVNDCTQQATNMTALSACVDKSANDYLLKNIWCADRWSQSQFTRDAANSVMKTLAKDLVTNPWTWGTLLLAGAGASAFTYRKSIGEFMRNPRSFLPSRPTWLGGTSAVAASTAPAEPAAEATSADLTASSSVGTHRRRGRSKSPNSRNR